MQISVFPNSRQNGDGEFSAVDAWGDIKLGTTMGRNDATKIDIFTDILDVLPFNAEKKIAITDKTEIHGFIGLYFMSDSGLSESRPICTIQGPNRCHQRSRGFQMS